MAMLYGIAHYGGVCPMDTDARQDIGGISEMVPIHPDYSHILTAAFPDGILVEREADKMAMLRPICTDEIGNNCSLSYVGCLSRNQPAQLPQPADDLACVLLGH